MRRAESGGGPEEARHAVAGPAIGVVGLLVVLWPLVRSPPLELAEAFVHVFAWWAALIAALAVRAWIAGRASRAAPPEDDV